MEMLAFCLANLVFYRQFRSYFKNHRECYSVYLLVVILLSFFQFSLL